MDDTKNESPSRGDTRLGPDGSTKGGAQPDAERTTAVAQLSLARRALALASTASQVKEIRDVASAAAQYAKEKKLSAECKDEARKLELDADRKLYAIVQAEPKAKGAAKKGVGKRGGESPPRSDDPPTYADLGLSKDDAKEVRAVGKLNDAQYTEARESGKTPARVAREARERSATTKAKPADPKDARIAELEAEVEALKAKLDRVYEGAEEAVARAEAAAELLDTEPAKAILGHKKEIRRLERFRDDLQNDNGRLVRQVKAMQNQIKRLEKAAAV